EHGRGLVGDQHGRWTRALVVTQVAVSVVLVVALGLCVRTFVKLASRHPGFDRDRILVVNIDAHRAAVAPEQRIPLYGRIREAVRGIQGVAATGVSMMTPVGGDGLFVRLEIPGADDLPPNEYGGNAFTNVVSPEWFR